MSMFRRRREETSFFVDSIDDVARPEARGSVRNRYEWLIFAIALATAIGAAGRFGLFQLLRFTGS